MDPLPAEVYSAASVRAMDRRAIEAGGIPGYTLMQRAGDAAFAALLRHWPAARTVAVLCGAGNNAGDGYVVARRARAAGLDVRAIAVCDTKALRGDAARAYGDFAAEGGNTETWRAAVLADADVIVDALLGTGTDRPVAGDFRAAIERVNCLDRPVLALDVPSGLDADTGEPQGLAVRATRTVAFIALKSGLYLGESPDHVGAIEFAGLDVAGDIRTAENPVLYRIDGSKAARALPPRLRSAHKGDHGRVVIIGGHAMPGAARLAGEAALRTGAGLVTVATVRGKRRGDPGRAAGAHRSHSDDARGARGSLPFRRDRSRPGARPARRPDGRDRRGVERAGIARRGRGRADAAGGEAPEVR